MEGDPRLRSRERHGGHSAAQSLRRASIEASTRAPSSVNDQLIQGVVIVTAIFVVVVDDVVDIVRAAIDPRVRL